MSHTATHLPLAKVPVANAENRVKNQQLLIRYLEKANEPTEASEQMLQLFEETLATMRSRIDQIRRQLTTALH